jgi:hypothetical protein
MKRKNLLFDEYYTYRYSLSMVTAGQTNDRLNLFLSYALRPDSHAQSWTDLIQTTAVKELWRFLTKIMSVHLEQRGTEPARVETSLL